MSLSFSMIYSLSLLQQLQKDMWQCEMKKRKAQLRMEGEELECKKVMVCNLPNCFEISTCTVCICVCTMHTYVSFHQSLAFCFGDYMHQGTNDGNITKSRRDYREDDRRSEWEGGRGTSVCLFLQIWHETAPSVGLKLWCYQGLTGRLTDAQFASWTLTLHYSCSRPDRYIYSLCTPTHSHDLLGWAGEQILAPLVHRNRNPKELGSHGCDTTKDTYGSLIRYTVRKTNGQKLYL